MKINKRSDFFEALQNKKIKDHIAVSTKIRANKKTMQIPSKQKNELYRIKNEVRSKLEGSLSIEKFKRIIYFQIR